MMVPGGMEVPSRFIFVMLLLVWVPKLAGETAGVSVCLRLKNSILHKNLPANGLFNTL